MRTSEPVTIHRDDYAPPAYRHPTVHLCVELDPVATRVTARLAIERASDAPDDAPLRLDGVGLTLESVRVDGAPLPDEAWTRTDEALLLHAPGARFTLETVVTVNPDANTALEGLYRSAGTFCTQCEAEGFRKITFALDRPDVLSVYDVELIASPALATVLLSNGNLVEERTLDDGRRMAHWHDPHPKPSYLFALVAGQLTEIDDRFVTASGREVRLSIHVEAHNASRCDFAMASLKHAMAWDERVYGFEYDLERYMIVAVDDFNMGAMENKGLNVFNSKFVLADLETATDTDFLWTEAVIAHEYFHNWTGNRITCRDWFQLSLKEGLTVYRDQSFTADRHSPTVKRIDDVRRLRSAQFPEDAGPLAHPIRPDSYIEINNFYTATVYEKGAEVIRMLATLIGEAAWFDGMRRYVERHDGSAATCEDFIIAMEDASGEDLSQFRLWYSLAGTPVVSGEERWDEASGRLELTLRQRCPDTPGQRDKPPMPIPIEIGLLDAAGLALPDTPTRFVLSEREQTLVVEDLSARPIISWLRGFSAPVRLEVEQDVATLGFLAAHDTDGFARWEAGQQLAHRASAARLDGDVRAGGRIKLADEAEAALVAMVGSTLARADEDPALAAEFLALPSVDLIAEERAAIDIAAIDAVREALLRRIAEAHRDALFARVALTDAELGEPLGFGGEASGRRALRAAAIALLRTLPERDWVGEVAAVYERASTMTDRIAALGALSHAEDTRRDDCLADFHRRFAGQALVIDKWFALQARSRRADTLSTIQRLAAHDDFDAGNPNRLRALIASFALGNPLRFHDPSGEGYRLLATWIAQLDRSNPQVAARLVAPLGRWRRFAEPSREAMRGALQGLLDAGLSSPDVYELVTRSLDHEPAPA